MIAYSSGSSGIYHGHPTSTSTNEMIAWVSNIRSSHHVYLTNNVISSHGNPANSVSASRKLKKVYVGKNRYPISIIQLSEVSEISWNKKAGLGLLTTLVGPLSSGHSVSDLITLVDNEFLMDTYYALQDTENQAKKVTNSTFGVDNLSALAFIYASGKLVKLSQ